MNNLKKRLALFLLIVILIIAYEVILFTHNSPEAAIRRNIFRLGPSQSLSCHITKTNIVDKTYGQQYIIEDFTFPEAGKGTYFVYVKKNFLGLYYCSGGGTGP